MSRSKIIIIGILVALISIFASSFIQDPKEQQMFKEAFFVEGVYSINDELITVTFIDSTDKTQSLTLEILGMRESFQKKFTNTSNFTILVPFDGLPTYGWKVHPIVIDLYHEQLGHVGVKTEIRTDGEVIPPILRYRLD